MTSYKIVFIFVCSLEIVISWGNSAEMAHVQFDAPIPQCAHWSVFRCCEILGAPLEMEDVIELLPPEERGHSMLSVIRILETIGFHVEAKKLDYKGLTKGSFPVVAHLQPDHYVTVINADHNYITLFDGSGRRKRYPSDQFCQKWSGKALRPSPASLDIPLPAFLAGNNAQGPRIRFESQLLDKGEIEDTGAPVEYVFHLKNVGTAPLIIKKVRTSCGCIESVKPDKPIPPMGHGMIYLKYALKKTLGSFSQEAYVQTNDSIFPVIRLTVSGNTNRAILISPKVLNFGKVVSGQSYSAYCSLQHSGDDPLEIYGIENTGSDIDVKYRILDNSIDKKKLLGAVPNTSRLELVVKYADGVLGDQNTDIHILTNIKGYETLILPILAHVVPPVELCPKSLAFLQKEGLKRDMQKQVTAISLVQEPFRITGVEASHLGLICDFSPEPAIETVLVFTITNQSREQAYADGIVTVMFNLMKSNKHLTAILPVCFLKN